jgi:formylglycine-generating enzyme required for sulfatase activity
MMRTYIFSMFVLGIALSFFLSVEPSFAQPSNPGGGGCPVNMVPVGDICIDEFEASVWSLPPKGNGAPQGTQFGATSDDYPCMNNGNDCSATALNPIYAASAPGVIPARFMTWFQAQQACLNVGKRLPTNAEWQGAAAGTPTDYEPGPDNGVDDCNTSAVGAIAPTGSRSNCVSNFGVFDMVGNVTERVSDWTQDNSDIDGDDELPAEYGGDASFGIDEASPEADRFPGAILRGGPFSIPGTVSGVFAHDAALGPTRTGRGIGFRCARNR